MEGKIEVKANRNKKSGRILSTKPYWPKDSKKDIFRVELTQDEGKQKKFELDYYIVHQLPNESNNVIWIIDSQDNCFKFTLDIRGEKTFITADDLNGLKKLYGRIKFQFLLELRYTDWGLFYAIVWNESFDEVIGRVDRNRYVRNILPPWILDLISENFKFSYLDGLAVANSGVTSASNKTPEIQRQTPPSLKRNLGSTLRSTSKKRHISNKATATGNSEIMIVTKTLTSNDVKATRLYVAAKFTLTMAKAGINTTWYVIGPSIDGFIKNFRFKLLPSLGRETELKIGEQWRRFCETYRLRERRSITIKIKSIEERTMDITIT
ncbi:hypothetical protein PIB30_003562 [Stylosanthes scabra]|uniref:Uncharacterized protein n=1 Tax=Stylosanthes scabra TaxID=79078 RepID=A0ABU6X2M2_9FABA|nr:hypothetical protein [Stylosanthes scabra]